MKMSRSAVFKHREERPGLTPSRMAQAKLKHGFWRDGAPRRLDLPLYHCAGRIARLCKREQPDTWIFVSMNQPKYATHRPPHDHFARGEPDSHR